MIAAARCAIITVIAKEKNVQRSWKSWASLLVGLAFAIGISGAVAWWMFTPKLSEVRHLQARKDEPGLVSMFCKHAVSDRYPVVMTACIKALLCLQRASADAKLAALLSERRLTLRNRQTIIQQFERHDRVLHRAVDLVVGGTLEAPLREALVAETLVVAPQAFDRRVAAELASAGNGIARSPDTAIAAITGARKYDISGTMAPRITNDLYHAYEAKLKRMSFPADESAMASVGATMRGLDCPGYRADRGKWQKLALQVSRLKDKERYIANLEAQARSERAQAAAHEIDASEAASELQDVYEITAFLIDRATGESNDVYEISFNIFSTTDRALLKTTQTRFTTKGRFNMYVRKLRTETIYLKGGGSARWPVLEEFPRGAALRMRVSADRMAAAEARARADDHESNLGMERKALSTLMSGVNHCIQRM